jgi:cysteinyl-tRNA synthetase
LRQEFLAAMDDDFNTGGAIAQLFEMVRLLNKYCEDEGLESAGGADPVKVATLREGTLVLAELSRAIGLFRQAPEEKSSGDAATGAVMSLILELRAAARKNKDFATADRIREALGAAGVMVEDRAGGTEWTAKNAGGELLGQLMQLVIELRAAVRKNKDFATSDRIRAALGSAGITLEDRAGGTEWSL